MNNDDPARIPADSPTATTPANATPHPSREGWRSTARGIVYRWSPWQFALLMWVAWLAMCLALLGTPRDSNIGLTQIAESWGAVERVALWQDALSWAWAPYDLAPGVIAYAVRVAFVVLFLLQSAVFWRVLRQEETSFWRWMIGPIGAHAVMLLMPPSNSDVFFYAMIGDLTANGINPYLHELQQFPDHPLLPYQHWIDIGTVYGPVWTAICGLILKVVGPDPVGAIIAFKVVLAAIATALAGLVYGLARFITGRQHLALAAAMLVAWQPNMTFESSGQVHNDPLVMLIATSGIALVILGGIRALRGGLVLLALSFATKFITLPLVGLVALLRLRKPHDGTHRIPVVIRNWVFDAVAITAVVVAAFLPFWNGPETIQEMIAEPSRLFAHPVWRIGEALLQMLPTDTAVDIYRAFFRYGMQILTFTVFGWVTWSFVRVLVTRTAEGPFRIAESAPRRVAWWTRPLVVSWTVILVTLSMLPVNAHPWYWTWPVIPVAILVTMDQQNGDDAPLPRWFRWYLLATAIMTIIYHTRIARY